MSAGFWVDQTRQRHALRDHSDASTLDTRAGVRVHITTELEDGLLNGEIEGDSFLEGAFFLAGEEEKEDGKSWGGGFIIVGGELENGTRFAPYRTTELDTDERYRVIDILGAEDFLPLTINQATAVSSDPARPMKSPVSDTIEAQAAHRPMLDGHPELLIAGTEERRQHLIGLTPWAGILVAQDRGADPPKYSTAIVDVSGSEIDRDLVTGMDSLCQVAALEGADRGAARRYDKPESGGGHGLFFESPGVYGFDAKEFGGPLGAGAGAADKHLRFFGRRGDAFVGGHVHLTAPHYLTPIKDDPLDAELPEWAGIDPRGIDVHVHMRHSVPAQRWRWMVRVPEIISPPPKKPPPPKQPPPKPPPEDQPLPPQPEPKTPKPPPPFEPKPEQDLELPPLAPPRFEPKPEQDVDLPPLTGGIDFEPREGEDRFFGPGGKLITPPSGGQFGLDPELIIGDQLRGPQGLIPNPWTGFDEPEPEDAPLPTEPDTDGTCRVHAFWNKLGAPTFVGQPTPVRAHNKDFRRNDTPSPDEAREATHDRPVGWHMDFVGAEDSGGDWDYTQRPEYEDRLYHGGTVPCVGWVLPPEVRARDAAEAATLAALEDEFGPFSGTGIGLGAGAALYFGLPYAPTGLGRLGWKNYLSGTSLLWASTNAVGALTSLMSLTSAGVLTTVSFVSTGESIFDALTYESVLNMRIKNVSGATLTAPLVVKATGYDTGDGVPTVAALTNFRDVPLGILLTNLSNNTVGSVARNGATIISGLDTSSSFVGAPVFSSASGVLSLSVGSRRVGFVLDLANPGRIIVDIAPHVELKTDGQTANFNAVGGASYDIDTTGGAVTATLPEITALMDGTKIVLTDTGNAAVNNITLARSGASDTIMGAASAKMITNYASVTLIARYSAGASKWQVT